MASCYEVLSDFDAFNCVLDAVTVCRDVTRRYCLRMRVAFARGGGV
jgi:hypothetical protein